MDEIGKAQPLESTSVVGGLLRKRREELGFDIVDIAAHLRIRVVHLKAIEAGRMHELPGVTYTIGFVRTYADHLGLEGKLIVADFRDEMAQRSNVRPLEFPRHHTQGRLPGLLPISISLFLALFLYLGWSYWNNQNRDIGALPRVEPAPAAISVTPDQAADAAQASQSTTQSSIAPAPEPVQNAQAPTNQPEEKTPQPDMASPLSTSEKNVATLVAPPQTQEIAQQPADHVPIRLHAKLDSWVDIRDANNQIVFSRVMRQGEEYDPPLQPGLILTTGNAGGLDILVNGEALSSLGAIGLVVRNIPLDVEKLKAGIATKPQLNKALAPSGPPGLEEPSD